MTLNTNDAGSEALVLAKPNTWITPFWGKAAASATIIVGGLGTLGGAWGLAQEEGNCAVTTQGGFFRAARVVSTTTSPFMLAFGIWAFRAHRRREQANQPE